MSHGARVQYAAFARPSENVVANWITSLFGSRNQRLVNGYRKLVTKINVLEPSFQALSDEQLRAKTEEFRRRLTEGETVDDLLSEAFAAVREASRRTLGLRHFDVQLIGGMTLHQGKIAEMRTGEGKTLMATLPVYLNALPALGVHVVTVNEYLAQRDADWMRPVYGFLKNAQPVRFTLKRATLRKPYGTVKQNLQIMPAKPILISSFPTPQEPGRA